MSPELERLIKELLSALAMIGGGYYLKIAKDKEPHATKNLWKILIIVGAACFIMALLIYLIKS